MSRGKTKNHKRYQWVKPLTAFEIEWNERMDKLIDTAKREIAESIDNHIQEKIKNETKE